MKRMRFLRGAHKPGRSPPVSMDPRRMVWCLLVLITLAFLLLAARAIYLFHGEMWWLVPIGVAGSVGMGVFYLVNVRSIRRKVQAFDRQFGRIDSREPESPQPQVILRKRPLDWPVLLGGIFAGAFAATLWWGAYLLSVVTAVVALPALVATWWWSSRVAGSTILALRESGLLFEGVEFPWRDVANLRFDAGRRNDYPSLIVDLEKPLAPRDWQERVRSVISRGASERRLRISLLYSAESHEAILQAALRHWKHAIGDAEAFERRRTEYVGPARHR